MLKMMKRLVALATLAAAMLMAAVGTAGAVSGVSISPAGGIELLGPRGITIRPSSGEEIRCAITLNGSFETRLVSVSGEGAQVGIITGMSWSGCTGGAIKGVLNFPWPIKLQTLDGVNPTIAVAESLTELTLRVSGMGIKFTRLGGEERCLIGGEALRFVTLTATIERGNGYSLTPASIGGSLESSCGTGTFSGGFNVSAIDRFTFLAGGEVREAVSPSPVEFGNVGSGGLAQRTVTISSERGKVIEEIAVRTGRYFAITDPNGCRGRTLEAGGRCSFTAIVSAPSETGRELSDTVTVRMGRRSFEDTLRAST